MKKLFLLLLLTIGFSLSAQTENYSGTYILHLEGKDGNILDYKLQLNQDNTFMFVSFIFATSTFYILSKFCIF